MKALILSILALGTAFALAEGDQCTDGGCCGKEKKGTVASSEAKFMAEANRMMLLAESKQECCQSTAAKPMARGDKGCCNEKGALAKFKVLVVDGGGSTRCALLGDMLAEKAVKNGWNGIVVYGLIRDSVDIGQMDIGVKALGTLPLKSVKRGVGLRNEVVRFYDVTFKPGDYLYSDEDGMIVSPVALLGE